MFQQILKPFTFFVVILLLAVSFTASNAAPRTGLASHPSNTAKGGATTVVVSFRA